MRQGGVLSTYLYKQYINTLLVQLENHTLGVSIGNTYAGCPTCADDIVLLSYDHQEMQEMLNTVSQYGSNHRFQIHPIKSNTIIKSSSKRKTELLNETTEELLLGDNKMEYKTETTHLGLTRSISGDSKINVEERITMARRTLYSLIKTGVHGTNGLNPRTSSKIYNIYIIPRLLYGLETLHLHKKDIELLSSFHLGTLKRIQSLPSRTATAAVYLLLGQLPIEAELHKRQLSLLHAIAISDNCSLKEIASTQYTVGRPTSFFKRITDILEMYQLPPFDEVMSCRYKKLEWKKMVKKSLYLFGTNKLKEESSEKQTLHMLAVDSLEVGKVHNVWNSVSNTVKDVRKAITKARILTGTYMLQTQKAKFNKSEVDPRCPICRLEDETLQHILTDCPAYNDVRKTQLQDIKKYVINEIGESKWKMYFNNRSVICQLIVDCQSLVNGNILPNDAIFLNHIEVLSRDFCHSIHIVRLNACS